jgi:hypothetical protein
MIIPWLSPLIEITPPSQPDGGREVGFAVGL